MGYHTFSGRILLQMGRNGEAAESAKYVADHSRGVDYEEAIDLWNAVPAAQRPATAPQPERLMSEEHSSRPTVAATFIMDGKIRSLKCADKAKNQDFEVTLDSRGQTATFRGASKSNWSSSFSDTFWFQGAPFSVCYHMVGMAATVRYASTPGGEHTGDLGRLDIREGFPRGGTKDAGPVLSAKPQ